jgi:argininosuccinate lyase
VRGKTGRAVGDLVAFLTLLKSLPLAYNRDIQEGKENLFDVFDTAEPSLQALTTFLASVEFDKVRMRMSAEAGLMTATDLADLLTTRGVPFRKAHSIVRNISEKANGSDAEFARLSSDVIRQHAGDLDASRFLDVENAVARRDIDGGTSWRAVKRQMVLAEDSMRSAERALKDMEKQVGAVDRLLGF